ncbi:hypothetical protein [Priestia abyssalis]|uniref:hypothetical protein n=1 Tax=Priestia abyssalis TaxID=1221450 RepID=UPI000995D01C|nr:hypothetical protein [Priestia abyssalis]
MSVQLKKYVIPAFLVLIFIVAWYADSSSRQVLDETNPVSLAEQEEDSELAIAEVEEQSSEPHQPANFELEEKLVEQEEVDGYIVETYREYEIYKDKEGNVTKSVPTSNYDYIRYRNPNE